MQHARLALRECYLHDIPGTLIGCWSDQPVDITKCRIVECGAILVKHADLTMTDTVMSCAGS